MDETEQYIEMCEKLPSEIKKRVPRDHYGSAGGDKSFFGYSKRLNGMVWLPRQDQLQEILKTQTKHIHKDSMGYKNGRYPEGFICLCLMAEFETFLDSEYQYIDYIGFNSMEQLWLAFVMDKTHNKRWNGSEWMKQ